MKAKNNYDSVPLSCQCGALSLPAFGRPIMSVACYCDSCQSAALELTSRSDAPPICDEDGGTRFVLYRKDRIDFDDSLGRLKEHRLTPTSPTRRVVSACCQSPMFLEFQNGHWVSVYTQRLPETQRPAVELRTMTKYAPPGSTFQDGVPSYRTHSFSFMFRLLWAWALMGFRAPQIRLQD